MVAGTQSPNPRFTWWPQLSSPTRNTAGPETMNHFTYKERNAHLRTMGFESYADYLESDLWGDIRHRVMSLKGGKCQLCNNAATQVHHARYTASNLSGKRLRHLFALCAYHHSRIEILPTGRKRPQKKVGGVLRKALTRKELQGTANAVARESYESIGLDSALERWGI